MFGHKGHGTQMRTYNLCIKPDGNLALLDPSTEGFVFALIFLRLKEPPRGKFRLRCEIGKCALDLQKDLPMYEGTTESDPIDLDQTPGTPSAELLTEKFV